MISDEVSRGHGGTGGGGRKKVLFNKPAMSLPLERKFSKPEMVPLNDLDNCVPGTEVIKLFFILNSAETKIYPAHKC